VTVFIGYTHPYKTATFFEPVEIFGFTDYQRAFGGLYENTWLDSNVAYAVQQFFLNGGSDAYVFGLQSAFFAWTPPALPPPITSASPIPALGTPPSGGPTGSLSDSGKPIITFSGLEPVDAAHAITVTLTNFASSTTGGALDLADYTVTYGSTAETYRRVSLLPSLTAGVANPNFIETRINGVSQLVWVSPAAAAYPAAFSAALTPPASQVSVLNAADPTAPVFSTADFLAPPAPHIGPFVQDGPLDKVAVLNLMVIPGVTDAGIWSQAIAFCERKRIFMIQDPPPNAGADPISSPTPIETFITSGALPQSINAGLYFPYIDAPDPITGVSIPLPPSGTVAGIFAKTDANRGVWKAPAGIEFSLNNVTGVVPSGQLTDNRQGVLNPLGVNCLRTFSGIGTVVFGARTTTTANPAQQQWRYVPVRRMALFIEQTLYANLGWVIFEPNDTPLWTAIVTSINAFMLTLFHQGAFQGATASDAFQVRCDSTTTTQADINNGIVNILVAFAPLKPAEFVVIQIAQLAGQAQS
jgi:hypothetical protein